MKSLRFSLVQVLWVGSFLVSCALLLPKGTPIGMGSLFLLGVGLAAVDAVLSSKPKPSMKGYAFRRSF